MIISEDVSCRDVQYIDHSVFVFGVKVTDLAVSSLIFSQQVHEHDLAHLVPSSHILLQPTQQGRFLIQQHPLSLVHQHDFSLVNVKHMLSLVGWILEFDHMQVILELYIYQLVS